MKVYEGTLALKKLTRKMAVYGNLDLVAQYVPQKMFTSRGLKKHPETLIFTITVPDTSEREPRRAASAKRKPKTTLLVPVENAVNKKNLDGS